MVRTLFDALGGPQNFTALAGLLRTNIVDVERAYANPLHQRRAWEETLCREIRLEDLESHVWVCGSAKYQVLDYQPTTQWVTLQSEYGLTVRISLKHFAKRFEKDHHGNGTSPQQAQSAATIETSLPDTNEHGDGA